LISGVRVAVVNYNDGETSSEMLSSD